MNGRGVHAIVLAAFGDPLFAAFFACFLCGVALWIYPDETKFQRGRVKLESGGKRSFSFFKEKKREVFVIVITSIFTTFLILAWTESIVITLPFSFFSLVISWTFVRRRNKREEEKFLEVWPEVTDHLISALHSGLSLSEALAGLAIRGPLPVRADFLAFKSELLHTGDFGRAAETLKRRFNTHGSDQILEAILLAKSLGGSELLQIFRTLGEFLRQDLALRKEIEIKHGWIKNSAHLSSAAPWILLLLLSSQPGTTRAFSQPTGVLILISGLVLTACAYLWMGKIGQLPKSPRVFRQVIFD